MPLGCRNCPTKGKWREIGEIRYRQLSWDTVGDRSTGNSGFFGDSVDSSESIFSYQLGIEHGVLVKTEALAGGHFELNGESLPGEERVYFNYHSSSPNHGGIT